MNDKNREQIELVESVVTGMVGGKKLEQAIQKELPNPYVGFSDVTPEQAIQFILRRLDIDVEEIMIDRDRRRQKQEIKNMESKLQTLKSRLGEESVDE